MRTRVKTPGQNGSRERGFGTLKYERLYLDEIARTPLLDAITEVELSKTIEAGLLAEHLIAEGRVGRRKGGAPKFATAEELGRRLTPSPMLG